MALTNPVNKQNIVDRFADYVAATANASIVWGTTTLPFTGFPSTNFGGAAASGRPIGITGANISGAQITASTIYNVLVAETNAYTRIRNLRARRNITGDGPDIGITFDQTNKSNMSTVFLQSIFALPAGVAANEQIRSAALETFFDNLRTAYTVTRDNTVTIQVDLCHSSCHNSCHKSRGRR